MLMINMAANIQLEDLRRLVAIARRTWTRLERFHADAAVDLLEPVGFFELLVEGDFVSVVSELHENIAILDLLIYFCLIPILFPLVGLSLDCLLNMVVQLHHLMVALALGRVQAFQILLSLNWIWMLQILGLLSSAILFEVQISNMNIILFNGLLIRDVFERWYLIEVQCISSSVGYHILSFSLLGVLTDRDHDLTHLNSYGLFLLMHHGIIDRLIIRHVFL